MHHMILAIASLTLSTAVYAQCAASCAEVGHGCSSAPLTIAEDFSFANPFDLAGLDVTMFGANSNVTIATTAGTPITTPVGPDLGLGDDESSPLIPLGFDLSAFGICADSISVQSNGVIWLGHVGSGDFSESLSEFESQGARIGAYWNDLRSLSGGGAGTIQVDQSATTTLVTYNAIQIWGTANLITFQVRITATYIQVRYDAPSPFPNDGIVGLHNGVSNSGTTSSDLTAGAITAGSNPVLSLHCVTAPTLGGQLDVGVTGGPFGGCICVCVMPGFSLPGQMLPVGQFGANCEIYIVPLSPILAIEWNTNPCTEYVYDVQIPNNNAYMCLPITVQALAFDWQNDLIISSNGVEAVVGT